MSAPLPNPLEPKGRNAPSPQQGEEHVEHLDDAVIGRAFRWSAVALAALLVLGGSAWWLARRQPAAPPPKVTALNAPTVPQHSSVELPTVRFTDVTALAGITFTHQNGAYGDKLLPETMGGGVAFLDFDNDGDPDLLFINSTYWPWKLSADDKPPPMALYRNDGQGRFQDATLESGLDVNFYGMGVAAGDYDNDGKVDVFITAVGENKLFHNEGNGKFKDVTAQARVAGAPSEWSTSAAFLDYDNDGDLDLFVGNYVRWSREIDFEVGYKLVGIGRAYGQPMNFEGTFPYLYRNEGGGRFADVTETAGLQIRNPNTKVALAKTLGVAPVDLDKDGWIDLVVANDTVQNLVFHNQRDGSFKEIGALTGIAFDSYGNTRGAMGIDVARYRNDDTLGIAIGNFANEMTALYVSQKNPLVFTDDSIPEGVGPASRLLLKFGLFFFDYDLDGWQDLLTANGHLEEEISKIQQSQSYAQPAQLFWNTGGRAGPSFRTVPKENAGQDLFKPIVGRGSAFADIDGDGDLDVVLTQVGGPPLLLRNDQQLDHHWLRLKLVGSKSNRDAIGAWVRVRAGEQALWRQVMPARSYLSQSELPLTIGLGKTDKVDELEVLWPGGERQKVPSVQVDKSIVVEQSR